MRNEQNMSVGVDRPAAADEPRLTDDGLRLVAVLERARAASALRQRQFNGKTFHVPRVGQSISRAYERLRNSAEYMDDSLLLQRAIRRYLRRNLFIDARAGDPQLVEELIVELTHAGYLVNDAVTLTQIEELKRWVALLFGTYQQMVDRKVPATVAQGWILDVLSVECEWVLDDPSYLFAFVHFAHGHIYREAGKSADVSAATYIAILKQLLLADRAVMRAVMMELERVEMTTESFMQFNVRFDRLLERPEIAQANRAVAQAAAPLRMVRSAFFETTGVDTEVVRQPDRLRELMGQTIAREYETAEERLNRGIIKSLVFLVISKVLIGVAIEVPIDYWVYGSILWLPLLVNLLAPPLLMVAQRMALRVPGPRNTAALQEYIADMLYHHDETESYWSSQQPVAKRSSARLFSGIYAGLAVGMFAGLTVALRGMGFTVVQGIIFFVFLSTASFLGFRLSRIIRELELVRSDQNILGALRDFVYLPFIFLGRWLSGKYAQFNIVSVLLDYVIELPLKTVLRHIRQWIRFLDESKASLE